MDRKPLRQAPQACFKSASLTISSAPLSGDELRPLVSVDDLIAAVVRAQRLKLITIKEVSERTGMGDSFIHAEIAAGRFPKPVKLGASKSRRAAARFVDGEVSDWIERHIAERDLPPTMSASFREAA
jgi:prophage regulatory protein